MARKGRNEWEDHLCQVLLMKPAEVVQEAIPVLEKHGCRVKKELKSELYYSSTFCHIVFQVQLRVCECVCVCVCVCVCETS